jgi:C4-type Zn-finger protein
MTFCKRLMDLYCSTRADVCPGCGVELTALLRREIPMDWTGYNNPSRMQCHRCGFRFRVHHSGDKATSVQVK